LIFIKTPELVLTDSSLGRRNAMTAANPIQNVLAGFARSLAALRRPREFTCGDCERSDRCGLPPSDQCIVKAAQIARGDWKARRYAKTLSRW
jgi:hypothetical protein